MSKGGCAFGGEPWQADLVNVALLTGIDPDEPSIDWVQMAARVYCVTGLLVTPAHCERIYFQLLEASNGYVEARAAAERLLATDLHVRRLPRSALKLLGASMLLDDGHLQPQHVVSVKKEEGAAKHKGLSADGMQISSLATTTTSGGGPESGTGMSRVLTPEELFGVLQLFRAVEGFDVFLEPVGGRVVNTVSVHNYATVIKQPVAIQYLRSWIAEGRIRTLQELEREVWKMASNCVFFNIPEGPYPAIARRFAAGCSAIIRREASLR